MQEKINSNRNELFEQSKHVYRGHNTFSLLDPLLLLPLPGIFYGIGYFTLTSSSNFIHLPSFTLYIPHLYVSAVGPSHHLMSLVLGGDVGRSMPRPKRQYHQINATKNHWQGNAFHPFRFPITGRTYTSKPLKPPSMTLDLLGNNCTIMAFAGWF